jgi:hypothetical protein
LQTRISSRSPMPHSITCSHWACADIMEHVDPIFFGDPKTAAMKVLGLN